MSDTRNVWVFVEQHSGPSGQPVVADVSLELLGKGRELADELHSELHAILAGSGVEGLAPGLIAEGADLVVIAEHEELASYRTLPYARVFVDLVEERKPYIVLFGATATGRDLAPRVASSLRTGLTADCTDLQIGDYESRKEGKVYKDLLLQIRPAFGGNLIATIVNPKGRPQMASVREGVMKKAGADPARKGRIERFAPKFQAGDFALKVISRETREPTVRLKDAAVIVAGGGGLESPEQFDLIRELAQVLAGEVGATRAAIDAGLIPHDHQIGQTGVTVRPRLYIAAGISGAIQHRAGMEESNKIIAINTDPEAPIFQIADYRIVGDLNEVIPMLVEALREKAK